ncbi:hypothetical protein [Sphingomonas sp. HMP6]|uniref:hypothetical protein n=1 Tax=Sphingomonas sp. HMP6 TaxID=1517551 RepID=UPI0015965C47|nr:hypothetical protein [Sphingomonas sp. HMP6]
MIVALQATGPIGKFEAKPPFGRYDTDSAMGDVERCLINIAHYGPPAVYRQPDRPDRATIIWSSGSGTAVGRVDLARNGHGTTIVSWFDEKQVQVCLNPPS